MRFGSGLGSGLGYEIRVPRTEQRLVEEGIRIAERECSGRDLVLEGLGSELG